MPSRQTRIFVPHMEPQDWAETLIGRVLRTVAVEFQNPLNWFWFSRYVCGIGQQGEDRGDCDFEAIPADFKQQPQGFPFPAHRSLRFRFDINNEAQNAFEARLRGLVGQYGYSISDIRDYDYIADTGGPRFLGVEHRQQDFAEQRAVLVCQLYQSISTLVMHCLVGPDAANRFRMESNDNNQNPHGSTFESLHHLFCNISSVPVSVMTQGGRVLGTFWGSPRGSQQVTLNNGQAATETFLSY